MEKAKKKVIEDGYAFAKGKSWRKVEGLETPVKKRAKLSSEERAREIESLNETLKLLKNRLMYKNQQLQKEKCMNNYKQCDQVSAEILQVQKEKRSVDRQIAALMKKEAKSQWYLTGKSKKWSSKVTKVRDNQSKLPDLFKQDSMCSASTSTDVTIIFFLNQRAVYRFNHGRRQPRIRSTSVICSNRCILCSIKQQHSRN